MLQFTQRGGISVKKKIGLVALLMAVLVAGCKQEKPTGNAVEHYAASSTELECLEQETIPEMPNMDGLIQRLNDEMNQLLHYNTYVPYFSDHVTCEMFDGYTIYRSFEFQGAVTGSTNNILLYWKESDTFQNIDLGYYQNCIISSINQSPKDSDMLFISVDSGVYLGRGATYTDFVTRLDYAPTRSEIVGKYSRPRAGYFGYSGCPGSVQFNVCTVKDNLAELTFKTGKDNETIFALGPSIHIPQEFEPGLPAIFRFINTKANFTKEFLEEMRAMDGVKVVEVNNMETAEFTGTELIVTPEDGYQVSCFMDATDDSLLDFYFQIFCISAQSDQATYTKVTNQPD